MSAILIHGCMKDLEDEMTGESFRGLAVERNPEDAELKGAHLCLRYSAPTYEREIALCEAEAWRGGWIARGAASVDISEVQPGGDLPTGLVVCATPASCSCQGRRFTCKRCLRFVPECFGAADDMPEVCDACWAQLHHEDAHGGGKSDGE